MNARLSLTSVLALSALMFVGTGYASSRTNSNYGNPNPNTRVEEESSFENAMGAVGTGAVSGMVVAILGKSILDGEFGFQGIATIVASLGMLAAMYNYREAAVKAAFGQKYVPLSGFSAIATGTLVWKALQNAPRR